MFSYKRADVFELRDTDANVQKNYKHSLTYRTLFRIVLRLDVKSYPYSQACIIFLYLTILRHRLTANKHS